MALAMLLAASGAAFFLRILPVLRIILQSKPDADFTLGRLGLRFRDFIWEVLLQAKVIRERPLPGLAHAFVFWGFCAFALVSLNHFAVGLNIGFLNPASGLGHFYFDFAALFAITCAISIAALFIRRFFISPVWLGQ